MEWTTVTEQPHLNSSNNTTTDSYPHGGENITADDRFMSRLSPWTDILIGVYISILFLVSLSLNGSVLWLSYRRRAGIHPIEVYLVALSAFDLLQVFGMLMPMSSAFSHRWIFGDYGCRTYAFMAFFSGVGTTAILSVLSVTRVLKTCCVALGNQIGKVMVRNSLLGVLLYTAFFTVAPLSGWGRYGIEPTGVTCSVKWSSRADIDRSYFTCLFALVFVLPILIMTVSYGLITYRLRSTMQSIEGAQPGVIPRTRRMTLMTVIMCISFVVSWLPYSVVSMWASYGDPTMIPMTLNTLPPLFAKTSVCCNPIVYFFFNKRFRRIALVEFARLRCGHQVTPQIGSRSGDTESPRTVFPTNAYSLPPLRVIDVQGVDGVVHQLPTPTPDNGGGASPVAVIESIDDTEPEVGLWDSE